MPARGEPIRYRVFQIGELQRAAQASNAIELANQTQNGFRFEFDDRRQFALEERFRLANGGYDLDAAVGSLLRGRRLPKPVVFLTSLPYSDRSSQQDPNGFFFCDLAVEDGVIIVSTYLWDQLPPEDRRIQPYILFSLASIAFDFCAGLSVHDETRGCPFDYCDVPSDIDKSLQAPGLCPECSRHLDRALRARQCRLEQAVAAERLLNRAAGRKQAFVAMPFSPEMEPVFTSVRKALEGHSWKVVRADDVSYPRSITDAIVHLILASDLVVADVTGSNPNVFYELGWAHAVEQDVLLLTQEERIPFDVTTERAIRYAPDEQGAAQLVRQLSEAVGIREQGADTRAAHEPPSR